MKTPSSSSETGNIESRLQKQRSQIYKPYRAILSTENEQQDQTSPSILKNYSLQLKSQRQGTEHSKEIFQKKRSVRLPSIMSKKTSLNSEGNLQIAVTDYVSDPFLNGKIVNKREIAYRGLNATSNQFFFLKTVEKCELEFVEKCFNRHYKEAEQVIIRLFNYTIDLNLIDELNYSMKILGDFHFECLHIDQAFFYYNEGRKCALRIGQHSLMTECLIQMATCASRSNLFEEAIRILKKTLEYIWYYDLPNLQLKAYDEIGKTYYMMGEVQKAKIFHYKFFTGGIEPKDSSIRLLSKQSLILEGLEQMMVIREINTVFLWMIQMPMSDCKILEELFNPYKTKEQQNSPRKGCSKDLKYFKEFLTVRQAIIRVFNEDFFKNQLGEMYFKNPDWAQPLRIKKYLSLDIQRNNHLKALGIPFQNYFAKSKHSKKNQVKLKLRKIKTEFNENEEHNSANFDKWFQEIASQAIKKYRNKNSQMLSKVNVRGMGKNGEASSAIFRTVYNQYFDLVVSNRNSKH